MAITIFGLTDQLLTEAKKQTAILERIEALLVAQSDLDRVPVVVGDTVPGE